MSIETPKIELGKQVVKASELMPTSLHEKKILFERSEQLSKVLISNDRLETEVSYIRFKLGKSEQYGIPYDVAKEVLPNTKITKLPYTPNYIAGVINWRGDLITIFDLNYLFNLPLPDESASNSIIVVSVQGMTIGILTELIEGSASFIQTSLDASLTFDTAIKSDYFYGLHNGRVAIINIASILLDVKSKIKEK